MILSLSFIRWERAPAPQGLCPQPLFPAQSGAAVPLTSVPQEFRDREPLTGILQWLGEAGAEGMLCWEKGIYCQPGFPPQLPNTLLQRNFFP